MAKKVAIVKTAEGLDTLKGEEKVLQSLPVLKIVDNDKQAALYIDGYTAAISGK